MKIPPTDANVPKWVFEVPPGQMELFLKLNDDIHDLRRQVTSLNIRVHLLTKKLDGLLIGPLKIKSVVNKKDFPVQNSPK